MLMMLLLLMMMMLMTKMTMTMIIGLFGQLALWAPSLRCVMLSRSSIAYAFTYPHH
jgi:hypothetical protein